MPQRVTQEHMVAQGSGRTVTRFALTEEAKQEYCILVVDDEAVIRKLYKDVLVADGYVRTYVAANDTEVQKILKKTSPDLVIMDLNLKLERVLDVGEDPENPVRDGFWMMEKIVTEWGCPTHFIVASGSFDDGLLRESMRHGAVDYIHKGTPEDLNNTKKFSVVDELKFKVWHALTYNVEVANFASVDPLTGLSNKRTMYSEGGHRIADFIRDYRGWKKRSFSTDQMSIDLSFIMIDLDDFKKYNDTHGHMEGDYALKKLANFLQTNLRRNDLVCRFGGEEIVIILPRTSFLNAVGVGSILSERFKEIVLKPDKIETHISFTLGISTWDAQTYPELEKQAGFQELVESSDEGSLDSLVDMSIQAADKELYAQKQKEKGRCSSKNGFLPDDVSPIPLS